MCATYFYQSRVIHEDDSRIVLRINALLLILDDNASVDIPELESDLCEEQLHSLFMALLIWQSHLQTSHSRLENRSIDTTSCFCINHCS